MRKFRMFIEVKGKWNDEISLVFEIDGKEVSRFTEDCIENILIDSCDFFSQNCNENNFDSRYDSLEVNMNYKMC